MRLDRIASCSHLIESGASSWPKSLQLVGITLGESRSRGWSRGPYPGVLLHVAHDGVDHDFAPTREGVRGRHLTPEDAREGCAVGHVEKAQRADRHMKVNLVDTLAEHTRRPAATIDM